MFACLSGTLRTSHHADLHQARLCAKDSLGVDAIEEVGVGIVWRKQDLKVLESGAGFYIGIFDPQDGPVSRESEEYFRKQKDAEAALQTGNWTMRTQY